METHKKSVQTKPRLYKSAFISQLVNYALGANEFHPIVTLDLTGLDLSRISVLVYGHNVSGDYATLPNHGTLALINNHVIFASYKLTQNQLQVGLLNDFVGFTPSAPYTTVYLSYYLFIM